MPSLYTCLSVNCRVFASRFLSGGDRYLWDSNFFSSSTVWSLENLTCPPFLLCRGRCMKWFHKNGFGTTERDRNKHWMDGNPNVFAGDYPNIWSCSRQYQYNISWIKNYHVLSCCFFFLDSMTCPIINHCMFTYPIMCLYLGSNVIVTISLKCRS